MIFLTSSVTDRPQRSKEQANNMEVETENLRIQKDKELAP